MTFFRMRFSKQQNTVLTSSRLHTCCV